jgi:hypothetical protein
MRFTPILGDKVYNSYFGEPLSTHEAEPGRYRIELTVAGQTESATIEVRNDPSFD